MDPAGGDGNGLPIQVKGLETGEKLRVPVQGQDPQFAADAVDAGDPGHTDHV